MLITPKQIRAARALLRLDQTSLAQKAGISVMTLRRRAAHRGLTDRPALACAGALLHTRRAA